MQTKELTQKDLTQLYKILGVPRFNIPDAFKKYICDYVVKKLSISITLYENTYYRNHINKYMAHLYTDIIKDGNLVILPSYPSATNKRVHFKKALPEKNMTMRIDKFTLCKIEISKSTIRDDDNNTIKLTFIGRNAAVYVRGILKQIKKDMYDEHKALGIDTIRGYDQNTHETIVYQPYSFDDIILPGKEENIIIPLDKFINSKALYRHYHLCWNIGILLQGEPGTGKSTTIKAIINHLINKGFELEITTLSLSGNIDQLAKNIGMINKTRYSPASRKILKIVIMEEIDSMFPKDRDKEDPVQKGKISMLLQFLDGSLSIEGSICIATTNYIDKLDQAFIRDGRFNIKMEYGKFNREEAEMLCNKFDYPKDILDELEFPIAPVTLQKEIFKKLV